MFITVYLGLSKSDLINWLIQLSVIQLSSSHFTEQSGKDKDYKHITELHMTNDIVTFILIFLALLVRRTFQNNKSVEQFSFYLIRQWVNELPLKH